MQGKLCTLTSVQERLSNREQHCDNQPMNICYSIMCNKPTVQKDHFVKGHRATHRVQVYNKRLCNCDIFQPRNCERKFCATNNRATVLHNCASQMCSTIVLHNCAPQLWSTIVLHKSFSQLPSLLPLLPCLPLSPPLILPKLCLPTITCSSASSEGWYGEKLGIFSVPGIQVKI